MVDLGYERRRPIAARTPNAVLADFYAVITGDDAIVFTDRDRTLLLRAFDTYGSSSGGSTFASFAAIAPGTRGARGPRLAGCSRRSLNTARPIRFIALTTGDKPNGCERDKQAYTCRLIHPCPTRSHKPSSQG